MTLAFTLCSNNYLAQAKVLVDSFKKHHPDIDFIIGLVDTLNSEVNYSFLGDVSILPVADLQVSQFEELEKKYSIVELNTTLKPFYFSYLFKQRKADKIIYLDPDTEVFSPFEEVLQLLDEYSIILTPQNCVPIDDGNGPSDIHILGTGIFNLGFIALSQVVKIESFLNWWTERLVKYGFADERNNMFFDQVWINFVPVFFDSYYILKHPGYNMAPSNLHERHITKDLNQSCTVNNQFPLRFYHYSGYTFSAPLQICSYSQRYTFEGRPELRPLYNSYRRNLHKNNITNLSRIKPAYCIKKIIQDKTESKIRKSLNRLSRAIRVLAGKN